MSHEGYGYMSEGWRDEVEYVLYFVRVRATTEKAILIAIGEGLDAETHWVPRSVIEDGDDIEESSENQDIYIAEWFCVKEDI